MHNTVGNQDFRFRNRPSTPGRDIQLPTLPDLPPEVTLPEIPEWFPGQDPNTPSNQIPQQSQNAFGIDPFWRGMLIGAAIINFIKR